MLVMARKGSIVLVAALLLLPAPTPAQELAPGQRIRVTAPQLQLGRQVGELLWLDRDSLLLGAKGLRWAVPPELVTQIDASRGQRRHVVVGLALGAAVGLGVGAILLSPNSNRCTGSGNYGEFCLQMRAGILVGGAGLGALVGALIHTERWAPLRPESVQFMPPNR